MILASYSGIQPINKVNNLYIDSILFSVVTFFALPYEHDYSATGIFSIIASIESIFYALFFVSVIQIAINNSTEEAKNERWEPIKDIACSTLKLEAKNLRENIIFIFCSIYIECSKKSDDISIEYVEKARLLNEKSLWVELHKYNYNHCKECPKNFSNINTEYITKLIIDEVRGGLPYRSESLKNYSTRFNDLQVKYQDFLDPNVTIKLIEIQDKINYVNENILKYKEAYHIYHSEKMISKSYNPTCILCNILLADKLALEIINYLDSSAN